MDKVRFGIVGTGTIAHRFANAIKNVPEAQLASVASRRPETADAFGDEFNIPNRFGSYQAMAQSDKLDVAYIAVPHGGHKDAALLMLNCKKAVICEKPLALNAREVSEMTEAAKRNDVFLMEAMWGRLVPGTEKLLEIIGSGALGEIRSAEGDFCYNMSDELDHHIFDLAQGGGSLLDVGVYGLYFLSWYLGNDVRCIQSLSDIQHTVDSHTCVQIEYENGSIGRFSSAVLLRKPNEGAVYGTKGFARFNRFYAPEQIELHIDGRETEIIHTPYSGNGFEEQILHTCKCVKEGLKESPINTHAQSLYIAKQMDEIRSQIGVKFPVD